MKRITYIILVALLLSGCEDFLSFEPLDQKTSSNFPANEEEVKQMMAGIFTTMTNEHRNADQSYFFAQMIASDEILGGGGLNDTKAQAYEAFMYSDLNMLGHNWQTTYLGIHRANFAIEKLPAMDETAISLSMRNQYLGEAYFLRAFLYHRLVTLYGSVPLKISTEMADLGGATPDEIYAQIASDLKTAIEIMPSVPYTSVEMGHVTRWAAQAMMARVWLFYTGFYQKTDLPLVEGGSVSKQNVIDYLTDCVDNSGHKLVGDFHELWPYTNSLTIGEYDYIQDYMADTGKELLYASDNGARSPETVFALQFNNYGGWDEDRGYTNTYQLYFALRGLQNVENTFPFAGGWGQGNSIPKGVFDQWMVDEPNDPRIGASIIDIAAEIPGYAVGQWDFVLESNYWGKKYNGITARDDAGAVKQDYSVVMYGNQNNSQLSHGDDLIFIRFADVLLMLSELTEDAQYMNEVRDRADLPPVAYSLENLQKERQHELAFEGLRFNDMRRWGAAYAKAALESQVGTPVLNFGQPAVFNGLNPKGYSARYDETKGFFPIPQSQINLSKGLLEQVVGYRDGVGLYPGFSN